MTQPDETVPGLITLKKGDGARYLNLEERAKSREIHKSEEHPPYRGSLFCVVSGLLPPNCPAHSPEPPYTAPANAPGTAPSAIQDQELSRQPPDSAPQVSAIGLVIVIGSGLGWIGGSCFIGQPTHGLDVPL